MAALRRALIMGPICAPGLMPFPTFKAWVSAAKRSQNSRSMDWCTRKRVGAKQACPALRNLWPTNMGTNRSRSASAQTMTGACPPSSNVVRLNPSEHCRASVRPTPTEPVNDTLRMTGLAIKVSDISTGFPYTSCSAPGGSSACRQSTMAATAAGVSSAALTITEHPAANAPPILRAVNITG